MTGYSRIGTALALAAFVGACSLGSMLGGGKAPATLYTLSAQAPPASAARSAAAGETITVHLPIVAEELRTVRVPVQVTPTQVQYVQDLQLVDMPNRLFQELLEETVRRTTSRVVLDPDNAALDPGLVVTGELQRFGYDAQTGMVVVRYDASLATQGGTHVQTRRFEATLPADGTAATIAPALNDAANQVAMQVAAWIGG